MIDIAFDVETALIEPGRQFPPIACGAFYLAGGAKLLLHVSQLKPVLQLMLEEPSVRLIGHGMSYDMGCTITQWPDLTPLVFKAYDDCRIVCTEIRARLIDIAHGLIKEKEETSFYYNSQGSPVVISYKLAALAKRFLGRNMSGKGGVQLEYGDLIDVPIDYWSTDQREYPVEDVRNTYDLYVHQMLQQVMLQDEYRQVRAAMWLKLMSGRGIHTSAVPVERFKLYMQEKHSALLYQLRQYGLVTIDKNGKAKRKQKIAQERLRAVWNYVLPLPLTATGLPKLTGEVLEQVADEGLRLYGKFSSLNKSITTDIPLLEKGVTIPIHTRYIPIRVTGRTSSRKPNLQNLPRDKKDQPNVRECFAPRHGFIFGQADYGAFELCAVAQVCYTILGKSRLRDALNAGLDPHLEIAALIIGKPYAEAKAMYEAGNKYVDDARLTGKIANFGFWGGMGPKSLVEFAYSTYRVRITLDQAKDLKRHFMTAWPEAVEYFAMVSGLVGGGNGTVQQLFSNRFRGNCGYCQAANTLFQGLAAEAAKHAGWLIARACYAEPSSPMYGSYPVFFGHDEFITEVPEYKAAEAAEEQSRLMIIGAKAFMPDLEIRAEPCLMMAWHKKAKTVRDMFGKLVVWQPS